MLREHRRTLSQGCSIPGAAATYSHDVWPSAHWCHFGGPEMHQVLVEGGWHEVPRCHRRAHCDAGYFSRGAGAKPLQVADRRDRAKVNEAVRRYQENRKCST
jgi:hypothetical protein